MESGHARKWGSLVIKRFPVLRDKTGYVRGYLPYLSFDLPLFFRLLFKKRPDVVLVEPPPTTGAVVRVAGALRRVPYVWYAADVWSDATRIAGAPKLVASVLELMERFAIGGAAGVIAVSEGVAKRVRQLGGRNVTVIPNGIDTRLYQPNAAPLTEDELAEYGVTSPYLIYAGTASEWQGAEIFLPAFEKLLVEFPELQLLYVGQGSAWQEIRAKAGELNRKAGREAVVLIPTMGPQEAARLMAGAEVALVSIVPDRGYDFAYPTKVLAALAVGTPVLYAGKGPVVADLEGASLGRVATYHPDRIAEQVAEMLYEEVTDAAPNRLHAWVEENRSMKAMGAAAAKFVLSKGRTPIR